MGTIRSWLKAQLRKFDIVVVSTSHAGVRYLDYPAETIFSDILLRTFPTLDRLNFVQVGANDGQRADPIQRFISKASWSGVFVEPIPHFCANLRRTYPDSSRFSIINAAVDQISGERSLYSLREDLTSVPDWAWGLASFDLHRVQTAAKDLGLSAADIIERKVRTVTWSDLWSLFGHRSCDVLVVDTEGYDITLLRLAELEKIKPKVIHFEHSCTTRDEQLAFYHQLLGLGYELATSEGDTIAYLSRIRS